MSTDTPAQSLRTAAQAVLDRWDSPQWKWAQQGPTADLMADLRRALDSSTQPAPSPAVAELVEALRALLDEQDAQQGYATPAAYDRARAALSRPLPLSGGQAVMPNAKVTGLSPKE